MYEWFGNKALSYPVGLISTDEVMLGGHAGGIFDGTYNHQMSNQESYLTIESPFWTMTPTGGYNPYGVTSWYTNAFFVGSTGVIGEESIGGTPAIRPVINIRLDVSIRGNGTKNEPYEIL